MSVESPAVQVPKHMNASSPLDGVWLKLKAAGKKQALQDLAGRAAEASGLDARLVYEALSERERLGSTALGAGVAIPHARFAGLDRVWVFIASFETPLAFDASDERPVDLVVVLLAPQDAGADHLMALARMARILRQPDITARMRKSNTADALEAAVLRALEE